MFTESRVTIKSPHANDLSFLGFHRLPNDGYQASHKDQRMVSCHQAKVPGRKSVYDTNFAPLGWRESRVTMKFPHVNDFVVPGGTKGAEDCVSLCMLSSVLSYR